MINIIPCAADQYYVKFFPIDGGVVPDDLAGKMSFFNKGINQHPVINEEVFNVTDVPGYEVWFLGTAEESNSGHLIQIGQRPSRFRLRVI